MEQREIVFDQRVLDAVEKARHVPSVPAVVIEVLKVARDEEAGAEELAHVVSLDPALSAKILKVSISELKKNKEEKIRSLIQKFSMFQKQGFSPSMYIKMDDEFASKLS